MSETVRAIDPLHTGRADGWLEPRRALSAGMLVAVQLEPERTGYPDLTAIVDTLEGRVLQVVTTVDIRGLVVSNGVGTYVLLAGDSAK